MKKMYSIILVILAICILAYVYENFFSSTLTPTTPRTVGNIFSISMPTSYAPKMLVSQDPVQLLAAEKQAYPTFTGLSQKLVVEFLGDGPKLYDEAGDKSYSSHLLVAVYNGAATENEEQLIYQFPPTDVSYSVQNPYNTNGPSLQWLNSTSNNGYTIKNGLYKNGVAGKYDLNVAIYTKDNFRLVFYTSSQLYSQQTIDKFVEQMGDSVVLNKDAVAKYFQLVHG